MQENEERRWRLLMWFLDMTVAPPLLYLPGILWLAVASTPLRRRNLLPWSVVPLLGGAALNGVVVGWGWGVTSLLAAVLLALMFALTGIFSRATTLAVAPSVAALPLPAWSCLILGVVLVGAIAALRLSRHGGRDYLRMMTLETMSSVGYDGTGTVRKPSASRLPVLPEDVTDETSRKVVSERLSTAPYLLTAWVCFALFSMWLQLAG